MLELYVVGLQTQLSASRLGSWFSGQLSHAVCAAFGILVVGHAARYRINIAVTRLIVMVSKNQAETCTKR